MPKTTKLHKKTNSITQVRYGCAIGAVCSVSAIPRVIPITHCGPGCVNKQYGAITATNGTQGTGYGGGAVVPSVNATEKEVVFGGVDRLRELIESSIKILDADLFVVLTGCFSDLVGDDIGSVVSEFQDKGVPIVYAETGGFKGNNFTGHELVTRAIIDQYVGDYDGPKTKGLVNVWSLLPYHNTFWRGDLTEIKRILEGAGLKVNILYGVESKGVKEWKDIPKAQFNLVLSPWLGLQTAEYLEKKYDQPYLHIPAIPIGEEETSAFLRKVVDFAGISTNKAEKFIKRESERYYYYLEHFADFYAEYWWGLPSKFATVGDSAYNLAITRFLVNQLGLIPVKQIITENPPLEYRKLINEQYRHLSDDVSVEAEFEEDGFLIQESLRSTDFGAGTPTLFATSWEKDTAKELKGYLIEIGFPLTSEVILSRTYVGYQGALTLLEKIYSKIVNSRP